MAVRNGRDAVVVGAGAAGPSAALTLTRARRTVTVVDAGEPRNAPADAVHGLLGLEGINPAVLLARGREEVLGYGGVRSPSLPVLSRVGGTRSSHRSTGHEPDGGPQGVPVPGVWVVGNATDLGAQVSGAAAAGALAAQHINADLINKDLDRAVAELGDAQTGRNIR